MTNVHFSLMSVSLHISKLNSVLQKLFQCDRLSDTTVEILAGSQSTNKKI